jgi:tetratricopeptide (TPR) repeat protein
LTRPSAWIVVAAAIAWVAPATAQMSRDFDRCGRPSSEQQIRACTAIIQSRTTSQHNRALADFNRGLSYDQAGDEDRAFADYSEAIRLDPNESRRSSIAASSTPGDKITTGRSPPTAKRSGPHRAVRNRGRSYFAKNDGDRAA